ncbi:hypothetical protein J8M21_25605 [Pseudoalteromonas luteoviolacea]|uniref:hypothetical protein n=1 Tax=Pseudoalteromonas luteoviolacea TaxID=43657 RepID=UPI001B3A1823|nr:hypothetical protein [Pseudoalteromonas luteoviolacea]MBQ4880579.1 hypothetical protein [Pseudoalteromonas luteoviolacea]MBQ4909620.1 hypothetical protein [Pseudoalteromonas luteoviolacea]
MNYKEAKEIVQFHATEGIAYTSRFGKYPNREDFTKLLEALEMISGEVSGAESIERELVSWLFTISDQVQNNFNGAADKGIELTTDFSESDVFEINMLMYAIFEQ